MIAQDEFIDKSVKLKDMLLKQVADFWENNKRDLSKKDMLMINSVALSCLCAQITRAMFKKETSMEIKTSFLCDIHKHAQSLLKDLDGEQSDE